MPRPSARGWRRVRLFLLLLVLLLVLPLEPHFFQFLVRHLVELEGWRHGVNLHVRRVEGTIFGRVVFIDSRCDQLSRTGVVTRLEVARAEAELNWANLLRRDGERCLERLSIRGVNGKVILPSGKTPEVALEKPARATRGISLPMPTRIDARNVTFVIQTNGDYIRLDGARFTASDLEPGVVCARHVTIKQPWLNRSFFNVRGRTAMQDGRLAVANVVLEEGVIVRSFSADLSHLPSGNVDVELHMMAFGGTVRGQAQMLAGDAPFAFDASGAFSRIDIAQLVAFLGRSEPAGGMIDEGKFTFRGAPSDYRKATASLRLDATHFQWESRQWDSLVLGATLMNQHLRVPEFELHQGANRLSLSGEIDLQPHRTPWWEREFRCDIAANIDNLTELSALLLPEFRFAAGKAALDGSIRGQNKQFTGQLIVTGSALKWRDAPIENLHAALKLTGNECRLTSIQVFNDNDYVRGRGVVNILGPTQYWIELRAAVDELGTYAALLQKPVVGEALAGGGVIEWSGEGSAKGHSGTFLARLKKVRTLGALATQLHPINAELEGYYAPGIMRFSTFTLADDEATFKADVAIGDKSLAVKNIRLLEGERLRLEGDAVLPLDLWRAWPNISLAAILTEDAPTTINLTAHDLDLAKASALSGWKFPVAGIVRGTFLADGPINSLNLSGTFNLKEGSLAWRDGAESLNEVEADITAQKTQLVIPNVRARHRFGSISGSGTIDLQNIRVPQLDLALASERAILPVACSDGRQPPADIAVALQLRLDGPAAAAVVHGTAHVLEVNLHGPLNLGAIWEGKPFAVSLGFLPCEGWRFDIECATEGLVALAEQQGEMAAQLRLAGTREDPELSGTIQLRDVPAICGAMPLHAERMTLDFHEGSPEPTIDLAAHGELFEQPFTAHVIGPLAHAMHFVVLPPSLTEEAVCAALGGEMPAFNPSRPPLSFRMAAPVPDGIQVFEWREIPAAGSAQPANVTSTAPPSPAREGFLQ